MITVGTEDTIGKENLRPIHRIFELWTETINKLTLPAL